MKTVPTDVLDADKASVAICEALLEACAVYTCMYAYIAPQMQLYRNRQCDKILRSDNVLPCFIVSVVDAEVIRSAMCKQQRICITVAAVVTNKGWLSRCDVSGELNLFWSWPCIRPPHLTVATTFELMSTLEKRHKQSVPTRGLWGSEHQPPVTPPSVPMLT